MRQLFIPNEFGQAKLPLDIRLLLKKEIASFCMTAQSSVAAADACLNPLVGVRHHRNQQVDQHHRCDQHVKAEDELKMSTILERQRSKIRGK